LYFRNTISAVADAGKLPEYEELFDGDYSAMRWYPMTDYLTRLAVAGALIAGPENVHEGMRQIGRRYAVAFASSLLGRTMLRLLSRDPCNLLKQACASRRQSVQNGRWEVEFTGQTEAVVTMHQEYIWIESNLLGAAQGTFESIGLKVSAECELNGPFEGTHRLRW
jgi:uncharacterized protein (TIGR02265 family)